MADPPPIRSFAVAMSVEALASSWARREGAPDGATVVVANEVAGRLRGGQPWTLRGDDAFMMATVMRPAVDPMGEALLWIPASLAAADFVAEVSGREQQVLWPDRIVAVGDPETAFAVAVTTQFGPGRVEHAIFSLRVDLRRLTCDEAAGFTAENAGDVFVPAARRYVEMLIDEPSELLHEYGERCAQLDKKVRVELVPRGEARGRVVGVDVDGFLVLESTTGMHERVAPATLKSITVVP